MLQENSDLYWWGDERVDLVRVSVDKPENTASYESTAKLMFYLLIDSDVGMQTKKYKNIYIHRCS